MNILITGYGGQGILTLTEIIAKALLKKYDVKQTELHGLAQRGGTLQTHIRFNKKVYSPLIKKNNADLIIALHPTEALISCYYANKKTTIVINSPCPKEILNQIKKYTKKIKLVNATRIINNINITNTYILAYLIKQKLIPITKQQALEQIEQKINKKFLKENKKVLEQVLKH